MPLSTLTKMGWKAKLGLGALFAGSAYMGVHSQRPTHKLFDLMETTAFGDNQVDQALLGTDVGFNELMNPLDNPVAGAVGGGIGGGLMGAVGGALLGGMWKGGWGGVAGAIAGGAMGAATGGLSGAVMPMRPYLNSTVIGNAFHSDAARRAELKQAQTNVGLGFNNAAVLGSGYFYNPTVSHVGSAQPSAYYNDTFPGPTGRNGRVTTGATGDLVLGLHNMRMG